MAKQKAKAQDATAKLRKSLRQKLSACDDNVPAGLSEDEIELLLRDGFELALRWAYDCAASRASKGSGAACSMADSFANRLQAIKASRLAHEENMCNIREIVVKYQEPDPKVLEKAASRKGQGNGKES